MSVSAKGRSLRLLVVASRVTFEMSGQPGVVWATRHSRTVCTADCPDVRFASIQTHQDFVSLVVEIWRPEARSPDGKPVSRQVGSSRSFAPRNFQATRFAGSRLPDDNSESEPPDPIPNSAVKRLSADGSVGFPHVRVGHRQAPN